MSTKLKLHEEYIKPYLNQQVHIKMLGGREVVGVLKGYDSLMNLVLDNAVEFLKDSTDLNQDILSPNGKRMVRKLGVSICRGTTIAFVTPMSGERVVDNPFIM